MAVAIAWNDLEDVDGPVRFMVVRDDNPDLTGYFEKTLEWPLSTPAWKLAVRWEDVEGFREHTRSLVAEGEDAEKLRELRRRWIEGDYEILGLFAPVKEDDVYYRVHLRDTIPLEDENGLWSVKRRLDSPLTSRFAPHISPDTLP